MWLYILISGQDIKKRLIRREVYSFARLRLFLAFQRRGCVARAGFAAMHTLSFRTRWRIRIVSTGFCLRCAYIFSNHSGHARPYVGKVLHNKIDVYVRLSSAKKLHRLVQTHTITKTRVRNPLSLCRESAPFCALHRLLQENTLRRHIQNVYSHAD